MCTKNLLVPLLVPNLNATAFAIRPITIISLCSL